ncbi:MAG: peptidase [Ignavibacteriae bacterium]|nr:peptidase [Ignavibacteriota bacterium]
MPHHVLLIFLDGVGIGAADALRNPFAAGRLPFVESLLGARFPTLRRRHIEAPDVSLVPANATLRVAGLPQSGTGQTSLYTGTNAARLIGQHFGPYVYSTLKPVLAERNIFAQALAAGLTRDDIALANAFPQRFFDYLAGPSRRMAAGMYAARASGIPFRDIRHLKAGTAVSADITAARWPFIGHPDAPVISAREAGRQLAGIAGAHRLTLFEYFLTDKAGHERSMDYASQILHDVDELLRGLYERIHLSSTLVIVTSDHGNLEDLSTKSHTRNPVPVLLFGRGHARAAARIRALTDVAGVILDGLTRPRSTV